MKDPMQLAGGATFVVAVLLLDNYLVIEPSPPAPENMVWIEAGSFVMAPIPGFPTNTHPINWKCLDFGSINSKSVTETSKHLSRKQPIPRNRKA
ncbi:MAG: hypothetical protein QGG54_20195, partial [Gammaproteobacteria bacterium]|nr:hypothetical protein [Gammaproteobacteria bacterium]